MNNSEEDITLKTIKARKGGGGEGKEAGWEEET